MSGTPVISIITPVFNGEKFLDETITSVLNAKIDYAYEYIVIDDGSTDSTLEIIKMYGDQISFFTQTNIGEAGTVNRGLEYAKGEFILVLSADDPMLTGELVKKSVDLLISDNQIVAVYPDWKVIGEDGELIKTNLLPEYSEKEMLGKSNCLPGPGVIFRKSIGIEVGGRNSKWKYVSDFDFWLRLSRKGKIVHLPGVLAQWRANENSTSISQRNFRMASERIAVIEDFLDENKVPKPLEKMARGNAYYLAARLSFFDSSINGRSLMIRAIKFRGRIPDECSFPELIFLLLYPLSAKIINLLPSKVRQNISKK
jgi:glycosyltransferase involved in cell wall biosynthesis